MSKEIKEQIDKLHEELAKEISPFSFVLNPSIINITKQIENLQSKCSHIFEKGVCKFCYTEEDNA